MRFWQIFVVLVATGGTVAACGSDAGTSTFPNGGDDASVPTTDGGDTDGPVFQNEGGSREAGGNCTPKTCAQVNVGCGPAGDGCGGLLQCGTCTAPATCGGGGTSSQCGGMMGCVPKTCASLGVNCGPAADGCGNLLQCGSCTMPDTCGGNGVPSVCGHNPTACTPLTCTAQGFNCGPAGDGCGGLLQCGSCSGGGVCGLGGQPGKCTFPPDAGTDAGNTCTPKTCAQLAIGCGPAGDGCGGTLQCGGCVAPQTCGGGGQPSQCGGSMGCVPKTCTTLGINCGPAGDGCGGTLQCGGCVAPQTCGGGMPGVPSVCGGSNSCVPKTCAQLGINCGPAGDGCGGQLACGGCVAPQFCGGGGTSICGPTILGGCDGGATTTLSGYVFDPANNLPVFNALVYVPVGAVATPQTGVVPTQCGCTAPVAYASAYTGIDGKFTLTNPPTGSTVTVVVELGKWQRTFTKNIACGANNLGGGTVGNAANLTLPGTRAQGNIPRFAIDTGSVDSMECVLRKMGIADSEFVNPVISGGLPTAAGRIHMYQGSVVAGGARIDATTPNETALLNTASVIDAYDVVLFPCQGNAGTYTAGQATNLLNYTAVGGRAFTTHYHYDLLIGNGSFNGTATWAANAGYGGADPNTGTIDQTFGRGINLAQWLAQPIVVGGTLGQIQVNTIRHDFTAVNAPAQRWMYLTNPAEPLHYTFDTPFNASPTCGRVVYSDFHVENNSVATTTNFPGECSATPLTPQEKLLEFMLFDLTSCVSSPMCTPKTCAQQGVTCGPAGDGCGGLLQCGNCAAPQTCGGGGVPGVCGGMPCVPRTCAQQGISCGPAGDGCGGSLPCGNCTPPQTCGGGGMPGQCGAPSCTPITCTSQNINCGPAGDGCGGQLACGACVFPQTCGGGGTPGQCGLADGSACQPRTCTAQNIHCGPAGDGCGGVLDCGMCVFPQTCGGGGMPGICGGPNCTPTTCAAQGLNCGPAGNGCGGQLDCGMCVAPQTCGGGGTPGVCGAPNCTAKTCAQLGFNCGPQGDGCGGVIDCGVCSGTQTCGGGGAPGVCGGGPPPR